MTTTALTISQQITGAPAWPVPAHAMPATARNLHVLSRREVIDRHTRLIPPEECRSIISEIDRVLAVRPSAAQVGDLITRLLGQFPQRGGEDKARVKIYQSGIYDVLEQAPPDVGAEAVEAITSTLDFLPSKAETLRTVQAIIGRRRGYQWRAKLHLAEHERRKADAERQVITPEQREQIVQSMRAKWPTQRE